MPEQILVLPTLAHRFSQFGTIASVASRLGGRLQLIGETNRHAGGDGDDVASAYHRQVDPASAALGDLVSAVESLIAVTGVKGKVAVSLFDRADEISADSARSW